MKDYQKQNKKNEINFLTFQKNLRILYFENCTRGVAQVASASVLGAEGRRFKSCRPDHF